MGDKEGMTDMDMEMFKAENPGLVKFAEKFIKDLYDKSKSNVMCSCEAPNLEVLNTETMESWCMTCNKPAKKRITDMERDLLLLKVRRPNSGSASAKLLSDCIIEESEEQKSIRMKAKFTPEMVSYYTGKVEAILEQAKEDVLALMHKEVFEELSNAAPFRVKLSGNFEVGDRLIDKIGGIGACTFKVLYVDLESNIHTIKILGKDVAIWDIFNLPDLHKYASGYDEAVTHNFKNKPGIRTAEVLSIIND